MKPKNLTLFYTGIITGLIGVWIFAYAIYDTVVAPIDPGYCCGANIGAAFAFGVAKFFGLISLALLILSFFIQPKSSKKK